MEQLIERVSAAAAIEPETARKAVAVILSFLQKEGNGEAVGQVLDAIPGARDAAAGAATEDTSGGFLGGLRGGGGGLMGLASRLSGLGLGMEEMQAAGREIFAYARQHAGEDTVGAVAASIPGLQPFV